MYRCRLIIAAVLLAIAGVVFGLQNEPPIWQTADQPPIWGTENQPPIWQVAADPPVWDSYPGSMS